MNNSLKVEIVPIRLYFKMRLGLTAAIFTLAGSILASAFIIVFNTNGKLQPAREDFDFGSIRSAYAAGTNQLFLEVDGMPGSSDNANHKDEIELLWYCFGFSSRSDLRGCNSDEGKNVFDKTDFDGFHFIMADNMATPRLMTAYLGNTTINTVTFSAQRGTTLGAGTDYLVVTLSNVKVTSYFHGSNEDYKIPVVEASLSYSKIHMTYEEDTQTISAGWDFTTNKPI